MSDFLTLAHARYSCRKFSDAPVEAEKIDKILEAAIAAPTAKNAQPYHVWVFEDAATLEKVRATTAYHYDAPVIMVVGTYPDQAFVRSFDNANFCDVDGAIVATHIMLELKELGLDSTWVANFDAPALQKAFPEMAGMHMVAMFPIGYAADDVKPAPRHSERRAGDEMITRL